MPDVRILQRAQEIVLGIDLDDYIGESAHKKLGGEPVTRADGTTVTLAAFDNLLDQFGERRDSGAWQTDRTQSDAWMAPRIHAAIRLDRAQGADRTLWHWLAVAVASDYVDWRWGGDKGINRDRWYGPIHKQAIARLWWGAELFRDGADYTPVERAFTRQDLINSYLHRPLVRCRSFALGIVGVLTNETGGALPARQVNDLARVLNLCTVGRPPELQVGLQTDDLAAAAIWASTDAPVPTSWESLPLGPRAFDTTEASIHGGRELALHGMDLAGLEVAE